jgi:signal transduction histidine kinase
MHWGERFKSLVFAFNTVSIRTKIVGLVTVCILFASASLVIYTDHDARMALQHEAQVTGTSLGEVLSSQSTPLITNGDISTLYALVRGYVDTSPNIAYITVKDEIGIVVAEAYKNADMVDLPVDNPPQSDTQPNLQVLSYKSQEIVDVSLTFAGSTKGEVHIGVTNAGVSHTVATHIHHILLWLLVTLAFGILLAYVLSYALTYPMSALAAEARELGHGSFRNLQRRWGKDEIGSLGKAFDEMSRELREKEIMRTQLLAQVLSAQEDERKRIARELHDDTSQSLTSLMVELKAAEKAKDLGEIKPRLNELRSLAYQTLQGVHNMSAELRPNALDDLGLVAALRKYTADFSAKNDIHVDLQVGQTASRRFAPEIETAAYRIAQEALANVIRHAAAKNVSIIVDYLENRFKLIVEDDGKGFDLDKALKSSPEHRLGLFGMYERASLIGGNLTIESEPGQGTSVFLEVPIALAGGVQS